MWGKVPQGPGTYRLSMRRLLSLSRRYVDTRILPDLRAAVAFFMCAGVGGRPVLILLDPSESRLDEVRFVSWVRVDIENGGRGWRALCGSICTPHVIGWEQCPVFWWRSALHCFGPANGDIRGRVQTPMANCS